MKKITFAILSLIISASVILTPSLSAFAFGRMSFSDEEVKYFYGDSGLTNIETNGFPAYHLLFQNGYELICRYHTCTNKNQYVSGSIISVPLTNRLYFVIKQTVSLNFDYRYVDTGTGQTSRKMFYSRQRAWNGSDYTYRYVNPGVNVTNGIDSILPIRFWFGSYYYIFLPIIRADGSGAYIEPSNYNGVQQYTAVKYSEMKQEELDRLVSASGSSDLEGAEAIGGIGEGASDELTETTIPTAPTVDASEESVSQQETLSKIDEMISNIDDFESIARSNQGDVSSQLNDVRTGIDMATGWLPWYIKAIIILGLIVVVVVKVIGR